MLHQFFLYWFNFGSTLKLCVLCLCKNICKFADVMYGFMLGDKVGPVDMIKMGQYIVPLTQIQYGECFYTFTICIYTKLGKTVLVDPLG